jgi:hypothetical protein
MPKNVPGNVSDVTGFAIDSMIRSNLVAGVEWGFGAWEEEDSAR